ncbi:phospholipase-like protein [Tanacetum coccineum]
MTSLTFTTPPQFQKAKKASRRRRIPPRELGSQRNMMGEIDIETLTIKQYLMLTQGNQAPVMVKPKFRMNEKDIEDMTIVEYMEYEAEMKRQSRSNMERCMCGHDKEGKEDALIAILKSLVGECKAVYANKGEQIETSSNKTNKVQGVSFIEEDDIQNEEGGISEALPCQLPHKELNPGSFTLPYTIGSLNLYAMTDLGASVNIIPRSIFEHLRLANLKETDMLIVRADMTEKAPLGIVENVLVKINKFLFPFDFMIMDTLGEHNETMILGRPFLATIHAHIDIFKREISLRFGENRVPFDMDGNVCHSSIPVSIDTVDSSDDMQEPEDEHKEDCRMWPICNPGLSFYSGYDAIYGKGENGMLEQWIYGNKTIDDTTRERRYYEWVAQNSEFKDNDSSHEAMMYNNPCKYHHEYPRSYFP